MVLVKKTESFPPAASTPRALTRDALHAISTEFLSSEKLMHAPLSEKKEFLKTKGLSGDEIEALLQRAATKLKRMEVVAPSSPSSSPSSTGDAGRVSAVGNKRGEEKSLVPQELKEVRFHIPYQKENKLLCTC